jgi:hypothetical protein
MVGPTCYDPVSVVASGSHVAVNPVTKEPCVFKRNQQRRTEMDWNSVFGQYDRNDL